MKNKWIILPVVLLAAAILAFAGCASSGKAAAADGGPTAPPYTVDLSTLKELSLEEKDLPDYEPTGGTTRNVKAFDRNYDILLMAFDEPLDISQYTMVTIKARYFKADGEEIPQGNSICQVILINDIRGDKFGPEMGAGPNTPVKAQNVGGSSGRISKGGVRLRDNSKPIGGMLFQNQPDKGCAFIEVTEITFHNGDYGEE